MNKVLRRVYYLEVDLL